jgi:hypothetical protein
MRLARDRAVVRGRWAVGQIPRTTAHRPPPFPLLGKAGFVIIAPLHEQQLRAIAQLVARFVRDEEVVSSSLTSPTMQKPSLSGDFCYDVRKYGMRYYEQFPPEAD